MTKNAPLRRADLAELDARDPLAGLREAFVLPEDMLYLDGNSLGALPRATAARVAQVIEAEWGEDLIKGWRQHGWMALPFRVGEKIARLVGAAPGQCVAIDTTSINLFKLLAGALRLRPGRKTILSEAGNFPTDLYIAEGLTELLGKGYRLRLVEKDAIPAAIDDDVAVVSLTHVDFKTAEIHDMPRITARAQAKGALMLWDLCHSAGAVPVELDAAGADLAVGCGYKFLNGGPGAPAFLYVARHLQEALRQPLSGWLGHADPFAFEGFYRPAAGIARTICSTPAVLGLAALECGVDAMLAADFALLRAKSMALTEHFIRLVEERCAAFGFTLASPHEAVRRGSQVSLRHRDGYAIAQALVAQGVIGDFRAPDILRFGFAASYLRYVDVWDAVEALKRVMEEGRWRQPEFAIRAAVT
ncbi:MAG TPA: kynureninase [Alphaproteobacteria bacterium]|nr:kynureninase [Alphaproteobacteria bacterium]